MSKKWMMDWRTQSESKLAKPFRAPWSGTLFEEGSVICVQTVVPFKEKAFYLVQPSAVSLLLNHAYKQWDLGVKMLDGAVEEDKEGHFVSKKESDVFDALELLMVGIVFAHTALESFSNFSIPQDHIYRRDRGDAKCVEEFDKTQVENGISLDEKLGVILPAIFDVGSPKGTKIWENYVDLKRARDRIIHMKSEDIKNQSSIQMDTLWKRLISDVHTNPAKVVVEIAEHFLQNAESPPQWIEKAREELL